MSSNSQSAGSTSPTEMGDIEEGLSMPVLKYSYNKNKAKKPRRNKSAFILFSIEKRADLKAKTKGHMNSNEMMVTLADLWKNLPKDEKERYELEARNDKIRYHQELETFWKENPSEVLQNKTKKNHVKKPCSAYAIFLKEVKEQIKTRQPDLKMADVLKIVSRKWKTLDKAEKAVYQERAEKEKEISRAKLGENFIKGEANSEAVLKKKKARQQNEIRKQLRMELGPQAVPVKPVTPVSQQIEAMHEETETTLAGTSSTPRDTFDSLFVPELHQLDFNAMLTQSITSSAPHNPMMVKNDFVTPLPSRHFELPPLEPLSVAPLATLTLDHLINNKQPSEPGFQNPQKSVVMSTNLFPEKAKDDDFLKFLNKSVMSNSELILDLLNFDSNPGKLDSCEFIGGKSSLRLNSNPFASTHDITNQPYKSYAPRVSRSEILNNAIMSALDLNLNLPDSKKEDDNPTNRYFDMPLLK